MTSYSIPTPLDVHSPHQSLQKIARRLAYGAETSARSSSRLGPYGRLSRQSEPSWSVLSRSPGAAKTSSGVRSTNLMSMFARTHSGSRPNAASMAFSSWYAGSGES